MGEMAGMAAPTEAAEAQCLFKHEVLFLELEISAIRQCLKNKKFCCATPELQSPQASAAD